MRTGKGVHVDLALWEALLVLQPEGLMDYAMNKSQPEREWRTEYRRRHAEPDGGEQESEAEDDPRAGVSGTD